MELWEFHNLERDEVETLFKTLLRHGSLSLRDRGIFMVLYNTRARVQEVADLRIADVDLDGPLRMRLHGKATNGEVAHFGPKLPKC